MDMRNNNVPDLSTEAALAEWGRKIVEGESRRISQGGIPIYNPTIAKVRVHYDIFMESYERQRNLQALTARSLEALASMRSEADALILDIWNQVERKYAEVMPNEKRLELCRAYGLIYYYRTGEKKRLQNEISRFTFPPFLEDFQSDLPQVMMRAREAGVTHILCPI